MTCYLYTESDLIKLVTPSKLLFERNLLHANAEHFVATGISYRIAGIQ